MRENRSTCLSSRQKNICDNFVCRSKILPSSAAWSEMLRSVLVPLPMASKSPAPIVPQSLLMIINPMLVIEKNALSQATKSIPVIQSSPRTGRDLEHNTLDTGMISQAYLVIQSA